MVRTSAIPAALLAALLPAAAGPNPDLPLDRPFTQREAASGLLEGEYRRQIDSDAPLSFLFPRPCVSALDSSRACVDGYRVAYRDTARDQSIGLAPLAAAEYRYAGDAVWVGEGGVLLSGHKGIASFALDTRLFNETVEGRNWTSYDGDAVDYQDAGVTGSASYLSYSRYRGNLSLDLPFGRLEAGRDAAQWGPALMGNLVFNAAAVPFNQFAFTTHIGPVSVRSLYGDIRATGAGGIRAENALYAHRYELRLGRNFLLGVSEQLILYGEDKPYLFTPVFPLFIAKSFLREDNNNGNLAFDAAWRWPGRLLAYGEFLLDDMESPSSLLFKDYAQNKWGALAGLHAPFSMGGHPGGAVFEAVRIEPWVYTHFRDFPAPAANADLPLGNPLGPNVLDLRARLYLRGPDRGGVTGMLPGSDWYLGLTTALTWKGTGRGSDAADTTYGPDEYLKPKGFLRGADGPDFSAEPFAAWGRGPFRLEGAWTLAAHPAGYVRVMAWY